MGIAKVTTNYQVTIPRDVRRIHNINVGDTVLFAVEGEKVDFFKMNRNALLSELAGSWKGKMQGSSVEYVKGLRKGWVQRRKRLGL